MLSSKKKTKNQIIVLYRNQCDSLLIKKKKNLNIDYLVFICTNNLLILTLTLFLSFLCALSMVLILKLTGTQCLYGHIIQSVGQVTGKVNEILIRESRLGIKQ